MNGPVAPTKPSAPTPPSLNFKPSSVKSGAEPAVPPPATADLPVAAPAVRPEKEIEKLLEKNEGGVSKGSGESKDGKSGKDTAGSGTATPVNGANATVIPPDNLKKNQMAPPATREEIVTPPPSPPANPVASTGWGFFYLVVVGVLLVTVFFVWRRPRSAPSTVPQENSERRIVDFSTENTREVVDLISAPLDLETAPQLRQKAEFKPEPKGNFEIRV